MRAELARRPWPVPGEIGADYSPGAPNCNAADRRKRAKNPARAPRVSYFSWDEPGLGPEGLHGAPQIAVAARFCALYDGHAQTEEGLVFPLAARLLDNDALHAIGEEMARRRGARKT